jgi:hypothetical protein
LRRDFQNDRGRIRIGLNVQQTGPRQGTPAVLARRVGGASKRM